MTTIAGGRPGTTAADDQFGWSESFIPVLARVTRKWAPLEGLTFGLYGPWGSGKTTILNMLEELLTGAESREEFPYTYVVRFNPWFYDSAQTLTMSFFATMGEALATEGAGKTWGAAGDALKKVGKFLSVASKGVSIMGVKVDVAAISDAAEVATGMGELAEMAKSGEKPLRDARRTVESELERLADEGGRVVVLIDDVDRLDGGELLVLLRLLRTVADLPAITLVVAMDEERVRQVLDGEAHRGYGRAYLEKIVQAHLHVPIPDAVVMEGKLKEGMSSIFRDAGAEVPEFMTQPSTWLFELGEMRTLLSTIRTPRDLGRYLNGLRLMVLTRPAWDLDPQDAMNLAALSVFFPDTFDRVRRSKTFLTSTSLSDVALSDEEEKKARRRRKLEWILTGEEGGGIGPENADAWDLVSRLFGDVLARSSGRSPDAIARRSIQSEELFDAYFGFDTKPMRIARADVVALVERLIELARGGEDESFVDTLSRGVQGEISYSVLNADLVEEFKNRDVLELGDLGSALVRTRLPASEGSGRLLWQSLLRAFRARLYGNQTEIQRALSLVADLVRGEESPLAARTLIEQSYGILAGSFSATSQVVDDAWLAVWHAYLDADTNNPFRDFEMSSAVDMVHRAVAIEAVHPATAGRVPTTDRVCQWFNNSPGIVVRVFKEITHDQTLPEARQSDRHGDLFMVHLVGGVDPLKEILQRAMEADIDDPRGYLRDAYQWAEDMSVDHESLPVHPASADDLADHANPVME